MSELIAHMDEFRPGLQQRMWVHVCPETTEVLQHALPTDWIPAGRTRPVIDSVVSELGDDASELWTSLVQARLLGSPLLRGLVHVVQRLGGGSPHRFLKAMPRGWDNAYKGWGQVRLGPTEPRGATVDFDDVAPYLFEHRQHWIAIEGVIRGLVAAGGGQASVHMHFGSDTGRVTARADW